MNYEKIKSAALALFVLISLAFTWGIWNYKPSYETIKDSSDTIVKEVEIGQQRKISALLKPSKIVTHLQDQHYGTVAEEELTWFMEEMASWIFYEPENISSLLNEQEFNELLTGDSHVELFFSGSIPFNTIKNILAFNHSDVPSAVFDRMVIKEEEQSNSASVYFVSVQERLVFKSRIESASLAEFKMRYLVQSDHLEPYIAHQIPNGPLLFVRKEAPVLYTQKYLPEQIEAETFKKALFNDPSYVKRGTSLGSDEYTDGSSLMRVNHSTGVITYLNLALENEIGQKMALNTLIDKSISFVNDHNGWVDEYRLFSTTPGSSFISYRLFLDDYPVFNEQGMEGMAELSQTWGRERIYQYKRPSFIIQLDSPLPETKTPIELESGEEAISKVLSQEIDVSLLTDMQVGYEMTVERESPKILALEPSWYYKYNGTWQRLVTGGGGAADGLE
ncbi:YycH family regulatory protein [Domibacillus aminovorans]|uniref:Regulatory protein YycH domain-containing protein n=1 Tax=Domibacillus aminovorans TaxID=29332 RepID=A0A177L050_9BACI|nr:two-component system activity regulator YycH [Domibacillus aminovorans]OAH58757.1 hypothetical protein AWH49_03525 [Domibacillus aminovorans]